MTIETYDHDIAAHLAAQGYGVLGKTENGVEISIAGYHETSQNAIFVTAFEATDTDRVVSEETEHECNTNIQIMVRNQNQLTAKNTVASIYKLFKHMRNTTIGSTKIIGFSKSSPYGFLRKSNSGFYIYVVNLAIIIEE